MESADVTKFLTKGARGNKMIVQYVLNDFSTHPDKIGLKVYWTDRAKLNGGGSEVTKIPPIELKIEVNPTTGYRENIDNTKKYILGNNYFRMKDIRKIIRSLPPGSDFSYFRFALTRKDSGAKKDELVIAIYPCNSKGARIIIGDFKDLPEGGLESNPSPPARPDGEE